MQMARKPAIEMTEEQQAAAKAEREKVKADKFKELAEKRVSKALDAIAMIKGLANKGNYAYTGEQVQKIATALEESVKEAIRPFATGTVEEKKSFSL